MPKDIHLTIDETQSPKAEEELRRASFRHGVSETIATGHVLTSLNLLDALRELRELVMDNAHRIPKARQIANALGASETILVEDLATAEDPKQERLPLDKSEPVEAELGRGNGRGRRGKSAA